jgi:hypothetical protein
MQNSWTFVRHFLLRSQDAARTSGSLESGPSFSVSSSKNLWGWLGGSSRGSVMARWAAKSGGRTQFNGLWYSRVYHLCSATRVPTARPLRRSVGRP